MATTTATHQTPSSTHLAPPPSFPGRGQSDRARSFRRTQYKKSAKARLEELVREITASRHEREALAAAPGDAQRVMCRELDENIKLLHDRHEALEVWSQELRCNGPERSRSRSRSATREGME